MTGEDGEKKERKPLNLRCSQTDCDAGLHYFRKKRRQGSENPAGPCKVCGADLIDWEALHARQLSSQEEVFNALQKEWIRHHYWHAEFDEQALKRAKEKGRDRLRAEVGTRLRSSVQRPASKTFRDGTQTPFNGNVIYYAQHATATCCRKCIERWHGIPLEETLSDEHLNYLEALVWRYLIKRLPDVVGT